MFTGIVEHLGVLESLSSTAAGGRLLVHAPSLSNSLAVSKSIAVNGCCLTITAVDVDRFSADLSLETLRKTSFGSNNSPLRKPVRVNLEQPLRAGQEFGGHFVLGHVDAVGSVETLRSEAAASGSWTLRVKVPQDFSRYIVPKGSISVDGISLTVANFTKDVVDIAVIPYTYEHTNLRDRRPGDPVNLEADVLGKYTERYLEAREKKNATVHFSIDRLVEEGF